MAGGHHIFSLYKTSDETPQYIVLRTVLPAFRNSSQAEEEKSWKAESAERLNLLELIRKQIGKDGFERIGELHGDPIGDIWYSESGAPLVPVYYMQTEFGKPWIIFGTADSKDKFLTELAYDEDLQRLNPLGKPIRIDALFVTKNDF